MNVSTIGIITLLAVHTALADLKLPALFSDGMVLQRNQKVAVWGWADPGSTVTVEFAGQTKTVVADSSSHWEIMLDPMLASAKSRKMTVSSAIGNEKSEIDNVLVGDVWFASGQSNMHFQLKNAQNGRQDAAQADFPLIRQFEPERITSRSVKNDCEGSWKICSPETAGDFSAVAYYFARKIHQELGVPIGLLQSTWGGSPIEAWSPMESLTPFPAAMEYKADMDKAAETFDEEAAERHNKQVWENYNRGVDQAKANKTAWPPWPNEKIHPQKSHRYPANIYNAMVHPLAPYTLRGVIWYQGENNGASMARALEYRDLLENMVSEWRKDWASDFSFYAVQLVNFRKPSQGPVEDTSWAFLRDSILNFSKEVPNAGMAVGIDVGEANDIHPKNKQVIGYRLARQALAHTYKQDVVAGGPIYRSMKKDGDMIIVKFDDIGSGLVEQGGEPLKWFAIAGADKRFVAAQAAIVDDTVVVSAESVPDPVAVRYAWADNPVGCNLFNQEGFPASPFRTDDWPPMGE